MLMIVAAEIYSFFGRALCFLSLMDTFENFGLIWFNTYKTAKDESIMVINLIGNVFMKLLPHGQEI